jgi:hypothetical protein
MTYRTQTGNPNLALNMCFMIYIPILSQRVIWKTSKQSYDENIPMADGVVLLQASNKLSWDRRSWAPSIASANLNTAFRTILPTSIEQIPLLCVYGMFKRCVVYQKSHSSWDKFIRRNKWTKNMSVFVKKGINEKIKQSKKNTSSNKYVWKGLFWRVKSTSMISRFPKRHIFLPNKKDYAVSGVCYTCSKKDMFDFDGKKWK